MFLFSRSRAHITAWGYLWEAHGYPHAPTHRQGVCAATHLGKGEPSKGQKDGGPLDPEGEWPTFANRSGKPGTL